jgi:alpha-L-rhamnosidase
MEVEIPANTTATVFIPAENANTLKENGKDLSQANDIKVKGTEGAYVVLELGSGVYHFEVQK